MDIILDVMLNIKLNLNRELTRIDANRDWPEGRIGEWGAGIHLTIGDLSLRNPDSTCRLGRKARQRQSIREDLSAAEDRGRRAQAKRSERNPLRILNSLVNAWDYACVFF